jgi:regulator of protease activity HflC (stomatin/prohibitin superfamily)
MYTYLINILPVLLFLLIGIRIVRPTQRGLIGRLGKYASFAGPGFNWINPIIDRIYLKDRDSRFGLQGKYL